MTGTAYAGELELVATGTSWRRKQKPPLSLTVLDRADGSLLVMPTDLSGGQRGGDTLNVRVEARSGAVVEWRPPASALFFPGRLASAVCLMEQKLAVEAGSSLLWLPKVSIPCAHAHIVQTTVIEGGLGAELLFWDGWAAGRTASGEHAAFGSLQSRIEVRWGGRLLFQERWSLEGRELFEDVSPAGFQGACQWHWGIAGGIEAGQKLAQRVALWQREGETAEFGPLGDNLWIARALVHRPRDIAFP